MSKAATEDIISCFVVLSALALIIVDIEKKLNKKTSIMPSNNIFLFNSPEKLAISSIYKTVISPIILSMKDIDIFFWNLVRIQNLPLRTLKLF